MPVIRKWGNSLALRIPMSIAKQLNLKANSTVECTVSDGKLLVKPVERQPKYLLRELLSGIDNENLHKEIKTGQPVGVEAW